MKKFAILSILILFSSNPAKAVDFTEAEKLFIAQTDRLGSLLDPSVVGAFAHLAGYMNLREAKVLSLRCKAGRLYDRITSHLETPKNYWGIVDSQEQADIAKKRYPEASFYVAAHTNNYREQNAIIAQANIVFMALNHTFHPDAEGLFKDVYNMMAPGAWFVIMEGQDVSERDAALQLEYPTIDPRFFSLRNEVIAGQGGNKDIALRLPTILKNYAINPLHKTVTDSYESGEKAKKRMGSLVQQLGTLLIEQNNGKAEAETASVKSQKDIDDIVGTLDCIKPHDFIYVGEIHSFIGRKY